MQLSKYNKPLLFYGIAFAVPWLCWLAILFLLTGCSTIKETYTEERKQLLERNKISEKRIFSNEAVEHLPEPIKKHLSVANYMDTPVPINADVYWAESYLKLSPEKEWGKLQTIQFNSVAPVSRIAYMKFSSMPVAARDIYKDGYGEMNGKLINLFNVVFDNSKETAQSALITAFCEFFLVPGYLLASNVEWEYLNERAVQATLTDNGIMVSGIFYFDENGLFSHFETYDRYYSTGKNSYKKVKFSAVIDSYKNQGDLKIPEKVRIIWHLPEGDFEYYKGIIDKIEFNV